MAVYQEGDRVLPQILGGNVVCITVRPDPAVTTEDGQWCLKEEGNESNDFGGQVFNELFFTPADPEPESDEV